MDGSWDRVFVFVVFVGFVLIAICWFWPFVADALDRRGWRRAISARRSASGAQGHSTLPASRKTETSDAPLDGAAATVEVERVPVSPSKQVQRYVILRAEKVRGLKISNMIRQAFTNPTSPPTGGKTEISDAPLDGAAATVEVERVPVSPSKQVQRYVILHAEKVRRLEISNMIRQAFTNPTSLPTGGKTEISDAPPDDPSSTVEVERVPAQNKGQRAAVLRAPQPTRREGPKRGLPAIPTKFKGRQYRSRLEARWAAFMSLCGWEHEYEPLDLNGWIPDFAIWGQEGNTMWVEVKPEESFPRGTAVKMEDGLPIERRKRGDELLILGTKPSPVPYAPVNRGQPRLGWLGRFAPSSDQEDWICEDCLFGRWEDDAPFGFCDPSLPYHDRITGERSGGRMPGAEGDDLARLWAEASNLVQWRSPRDDDG